MFFIIWGARNTVKDFGPVLEYLCDHCNNTDYWKLIRTIRWFTLFYIPIIPYSVKYFVICPTCEYGVELDSKKFEGMKIIAENNTALINGVITPAQYKNNISQNSSPVWGLNNSVNKSVSIDNGECTNCNNKNSNGSKFCKNCGQRI